MATTFKNTIWQVSEKLIAMLVNLVVTIYLARALGSESYGALAFILAAYAMVGPLANLGLNALVTRELVHSEKNASAHDAVLANSLALRLLGAVIGAVILILFAWLGNGFASSTERLALSILALSLLPYTFQGIEFAFHANMRHGPVIKMRLSVMLLSAFIKIWLVLQGAEIFVIALIFAVEYTLLGLGFLGLGRLHRLTLSWRTLSFGRCRSLIRQSIWLVLSGVAAVIYLKVDQLMLSILTTHQETGVYAVAVRLSEAWYFLATALLTAMFPKILQLKRDSASHYQKRLQQVSDGLCWTAVLISILVTLTSVWLINVLFGSAYSAAAGILTIHVWASVFVFMRALVSKWILAEDILPFSLISHGLGAFVNVALNLYLIPLYGGLGAAIATLLSYIVASYLAFFVFKSTRSIAWVMTKSLFAPLRIVAFIFPKAR